MKPRSRLPTCVGDRYLYPGTQHGFNNDTTPRFDAAAAKLAWQRPIEFLAKRGRELLRGAPVPSWQWFCQKARMPRRARSYLEPGLCHTFNRAVRKDTIFLTPVDYFGFERVLIEALTRIDVQLLSYCIMPTHWHLVLQTNAGGQLARFMHWLTMTHTQRWHAAHGTRGTGPLYQGRYKAVPVLNEEQLGRLCRYVEGNPVAAGLAARAEDWRWSSLWHRCNFSHMVPLTPSQILQDPAWPEFVNRGGRELL